MSALNELNNERKLTQSQKMMVFVLSMSLFGVSKLIAKIIPSLEFGPIDLSVSYFAFIPLVLVALFHPLQVAIGASVGKIVFADLLLGNFDGIGALESFIQLSLAMYIAGLLIRNPLSKWQLGIASIVGVGIDQVLSSVVDIGKVWFGVEELEAVPGLPQSIVMLEGISFINEMVITGVLFGLIPTLYLVPKLYGKIEPLLGMKPREKRVEAKMSQFVTPGLIALSVFLLFVAMIGEFLAELEISLAFWSTDFLAQFEDGYQWIGYSAIGIAIVLIVFVAFRLVKRRGATKKNSKQAA
ncbi:cell division protein FtsQ [Alkalicoccobacillus plakortidis]|uniref:Cell division protein FtsQ n=1 Tax=Alkalicoccobacillus plakortidis TaxID=444060 RepID=A0ABT0XJR0_9BACI|nr:cell division protein FtsQ [Alkalicoccobacillus plakortidis]MCM2676119.1 cell division protein FtsQ [Alkalicoccobacillus plakortidis]